MKYTILPPEQADAVNERAAQLHDDCYKVARRTMTHDDAFRAASQAVEMWRIGETKRRLASLNGKGGAK